jgi:hypothetical protein
VLAGAEAAVQVVLAVAQAWQLVVAEVPVAGPPSFCCRRMRPAAEPNSNRLMLRLSQMLSFSNLPARIRESPENTGAFAKVSIRCRCSPVIKFKITG